MTDRIIELIHKTDTASIARLSTVPLQSLQQFVDLIVQECSQVMQQEWYRLNNLPPVPDETMRELGMRLGKKSEIIVLQGLIRKHFESNNE